MYMDTLLLQVKSLAVKWLNNLVNVMVLQGLEQEMDERVSGALLP